ncbi:MAG: amidohydrolase family protein [Candidatus Wallbacteria bacterium]|nr:amidohydrolase family protein [Candidatus Wallbacteria bacterium]
MLVADGRIAAVGPVGAIESSHPSLDLGNAVLLPGLVNVHSHLECSLLRGFGDDLELFPWVRRLTALKYTVMEPADFEVASLLGAAELLRAGVTCTADCSDNGLAVLRGLAVSGLRGRVYQEVFGPSAADVPASLAGLAAKLDLLQTERPAGRVDVGISPHAPYTVCAELFGACAELGRARGMPLAVHIAESPAEVSLIRDGAGPIAEAMAARELPWSARGTSPVRYLRDLGLLDLAETLQLIHCVHIDDDDVDAMAAARVGIAHCPRSNAKLGNGVFPAAALADARLRLGIGTDSSASNNALSVLEELRFTALLQRAVERTPHASSAAALLELATLGGARCLGLESAIGSIDPGKQADLAAFSLDGPEHVPCPDPAGALVFGPAPGPAALTMVGGRVLCRDGRVASFDIPALLDDARARAARLIARF